MISTRFAAPVRSVHRGAVVIARVLVFSVLAVCAVLALGVVAAFVAPRTLAPLGNLPAVAETLLTFVVFAPMLAGILLGWGVLALGRRVWRQHRVLAWLVGVIVFTAFMDILPARIWLHGMPLGDRMPGAPEPTLLQSMGDMLAPALAGGFVAATLWWLLTGAPSSRER